MGKKGTVQFDIDAAAEQAMKLIIETARTSAETLSNTAAEAAKVLSNTAAESAKRIEFRRTEDHDLLITLKEKMEGLKEDIRKLTDGSASQLSNHESRLKALCEWRATLDGPDGCIAKIPKIEGRVLSLENSNLEFKTQIKTWVIVGGLIIAAISFFLDKVLPAIK